MSFPHMSNDHQRIRVRTTSSASSSPSTTTTHTPTNTCGVHSSLHPFIHPAAALTASVMLCCVWLAIGWLCVCASSYSWLRVALLAGPCASKQGHTLRAPVSDGTRMTGCCRLRCCCCYSCAVRCPFAFTCKQVARRPHSVLFGPFYRVWPPLMPTHVFCIEY